MQTAADLVRCCATLPACLPVAPPSPSCTAQVLAVPSFVIVVTQGVIGGWRAVAWFGAPHGTACRCAGACGAGAPKRALFDAPERQTQGWLVATLVSLQAPRLGTPWSSTRSTCSFWASQVRGPTYTYRTGDVDNGTAPQGPWISPCPKGAVACSADFQSSLVAALFLGGTAFGAQARACHRALSRHSPPQHGRGACCCDSESCQLVRCGRPPLAQLGGFIGDWAARRHPNHGRVAVAQVSVGLGVPLSVAMFKASPPRQR